MLHLRKTNISMKRILNHIAWLCLVILMAAGVQAQDEEVVNLSTTVTGNQEQPKVLYIVPWKPAKDDTILYQPLNSKMNNIFGHVERVEHKRQVKFMSELESK